MILDSQAQLLHHLYRDHVLTTSAVINKAIDLLSYGAPNIEDVMFQP